MTKGYIFKRTRINTIAMLFWAVFLFVLYILYAVSAFIYVPNAHATGYRLDASDLLSQTELLKIEPQTDPFPTQEYSVMIPPLIQRSELYIDGLKYRFKLTVENYEEVGIGYGLNEDKSLKILYGSPTSKLVPPGALQKVAMITIDGVRFVALVPRELNIKSGDTIPYAIFSKLPLYVGHDLGMTEYAGVEVASYCADFRSIVVEDENIDFFLMVFFTILFPAFLIYTIICLFNPRIHPNYIRIAKFGDVDKVCAEIDAEINAESTYREKKSVYTKHYIIEHTLYNTRVRKNHLLRN